MEFSGLPTNPMDEVTTHGPLRTQATLLQLLKKLKSGVNHSATLLMGGSS